MTTVAEAKIELAQIAERQAALQKIVDAAPKSLLTKGGYNIGGPMNQDWVRGETTALAYADALDTLLMLRHQPGSEPAKDEEQWTIRTGDVQRGTLSTTYLFGTNVKASRISPCFATDADARAAIDTIGADRILRMFRTLHGVA
jgi:hypothetical protein